MGPPVEAVPDDEMPPEPGRSNAGADVKPMVRVMGLADGPFSWEDKETVVVGAVVRLPGYVEGLFSTRVEVDGDNATARVIDMVRESGYVGQLRALMVKGASLAGFNVLDGGAIHSATGVPLITVNREEPDMDAVRAALAKHFDDWERRLALLEAGRPERVQNGEFELFCHGHGLDARQLGVMVRKATVQGALPEPVRLAHLMARTMVRGSSAATGTATGTEE